MDQKSTSGRLAERMARVRRQWQTQQKTETVPGIPAVAKPLAFTIAVSREAGADGSRVAAVVAERLGWTVYDRELVQQVASDLGVHAGLLDSLDEKHRSWLLESVQAFGAAPSISADAYRRRLLETLLSLGAHGDCVIVGRGAAQVLPAATTLRVRLIGSIEDRVKVIARRRNIPAEEAKRWIAETDQERTRFVRDHFQKDPTDVQGYDLVLNTARFGVPACAELIIEALHRLQAPREKEIAVAPPPR
jgi:cytidylate kinase